MLDVCQDKQVISDPLTIKQQLFCRVANWSQLFVVVDMNFASVDFDQSFFLQAAESTTYGFDSQPKEITYIHSGHGQS